jgi:ABC-type transport system substrate-binding protein
MRKLISASAVCAVAIGLVVVSGAGAVSSTKQVPSTVTVSATPTTIDPTTTAVNVTGNVLANSSCRKDRTVHFFYVTSGTAGAEVGTPATTRSNGDFSATLPPPSTAADGTTQVRAIVDETLRTKIIKGKKKGAGKGKKKGVIKKRKFDCLQGSGDSNVLTVSDGLP